MQLNQYLAQVVTDLAAKLPGVSVGAHPGEFDLVEMQRYSLCPPLVRVWLARVISIDAGRIVCQFGASVVAKRTSPTASGESNALGLVNALTKLLNAGVIAADYGSVPSNIAAQNYFDRHAALAGMHFWQLSWQQTLAFDTETDGLEEFLTLFATYQTPEDGVTRATDCVALPQE